MAGEARRHGWRVVAFTFGEAPGVADHADRTFPSRLNETGAVLAGLQAERIGAVAFSGKFWMKDVLHERRPDGVLAELKAGAALTDANLVQAVVATLGQMGIEVLDQRPFLGDWIGRSGCWSSRAPTDTEWADVQRGLQRRASRRRRWRRSAVVVKLGAVTAVDDQGRRRRSAAAWRRRANGRRQGGSARHDYASQPGVGPETIEAAASGGAKVLAVEAERVLVLDRDECLRIANQAGMALVGVE
jgi:DUF1009 family protein